MENESQRVGNYEIPDYDTLPNLGKFEYESGLIARPLGTNCSSDAFRRPFKCSIAIDSGFRGGNSEKLDRLRIGGLVFDGQRYIFFSGIGGGFIFERTESAGIKYEFPPGGINWAESEFYGSELMPNRIAFLVEGLTELPPTAFLIDQMKHQLICHYEHLLSRSYKLDEGIFQASFERCLYEFPEICFNTNGVTWLGEMMFAIAWREARKEIHENAKRSLSDVEFLEYEKRFLGLMNLELEVLIRNERKLFQYFFRSNESAMCTQVNIALLWSYVISDQRFEDAWHARRDTGHLGW